MAENNSDPRNKIVDLSQTAMYIPNMWGRPKRPEKGDVNRDGILSEKDIEILEAYIKGNYRNIERNQADIFVDGSINEMDVNVLNSFGDYFVVKFLNLRNSDFELHFSKDYFSNVSTTFKIRSEDSSYINVLCKSGEEGIFKAKLTYSTNSWWNGVESEYFRYFSMNNVYLNTSYTFSQFLTDNSDLKIDYIILPSRLLAILGFSGAFDKVKFLGNVKVLDTCIQGKTINNIELTNLTNIRNSFLGITANNVKLNKVKYIVNGSFSGATILNLDLNEVYANYAEFSGINNSTKGEQLKISGCNFSNSRTFIGSKFANVDINNTIIDGCFAGTACDNLTISDSTLNNNCFDSLVSDVLTIKNCELTTNTIVFASLTARLLNIDGFKQTGSNSYTQFVFNLNVNLEQININNASGDNLRMINSGGINTYVDATIKNSKMVELFSGGLFNNLKIANSLISYTNEKTAKNINIDSCLISGFSQSNNSEYVSYQTLELPKLKAVNSTIGFNMTAFKEVYLKDCVITNWSSSDAAYLRRELCDKLEFDNVTRQNISSADLYNFADIHIKGESDIPFYFYYSKVNNKIPTTIIVGETENTLNVYGWYQEDGNNLTELPRCVYIKKGAVSYSASSGAFMRPDIALGKDCNGIRLGGNRGYLYCDFVYFRPDWDKTILPEDFLEGLNYNSSVDVYNLFVILPDSIEYVKSHSLGNLTITSSQVWKNFVFGPNVRGVERNAYTVTSNKNTCYIIFTGTRPPLFADSGLQFDGTNVFVPDESITEYQINMSAVTTIPIKGISELPETVADYLEASRTRIEKNEKIISDFGYE